MPRHRWSGLVLALGAAAQAGLIGGPAGCRRAPAPPRASPGYNVILISLDTLRADHLNCYGYQARKVSPHIDALAADGILFENHITASPWTVPAHLSMLTSLYPSSHGVTASFEDLKSKKLKARNFNRLLESHLTLAEILQAHGFTTAAFTGGRTLDPRIGYDQGFDRYDTCMYKLDNENMQTMYRWIPKRADQSFFLFWHTFEVHPPYLQTDFLPEVLPPEMAGPLGRDIAGLARLLSHPSPNLHKRIHSREQQIALLRKHRAYRFDVCEALYTGGIRSADCRIGELVRMLRDLHLYDRCLILLTSDHGEEFAEHFAAKFYGGHGHSLYEEIVRVPLIIKLPHQQHAGARVRAQVRMVDIMPTALDLLGITPADAPMQGSSLVPLWESPQASPQPVAFTEALYNDYEKKSIRLQRYKFIFSVDAATVQQHGRGYLPPRAQQTELYDLHDDPGEKENLLASPRREEFADLAATLERHLREFVAGQHGEADTVELDAETIEDLKALGYIR